MYKTVKGSRVGAAILDIIFYSIITSILIIISVFPFIQSLSEQDRQQLGDMGNNNIFTPTIVPENIHSTILTYLVVMIIFVYLWTLIYYVVIPYYNNGSTIGKKILKIKVFDPNRSASASKPVSFIKLFLRSVDMWFSTLSLIVLPLIFVYIDGYNISSIILQYSSNVIAIIVLICILIDARGQTFYDKFLKLQVVFSDTNTTAVNYVTNGYTSHPNNNNNTFENNEQNSNYNDPNNINNQ